MKEDGAEFPNSNDNRETSDMAWRSVSNLTAGLLLYGGLGWFLGQKFGHQNAFIAAGSTLGIGLALYLTYARVSAMDRNTTTSDRRKDQQ